MAEAQEGRERGVWQRPKQLDATRRVMETDAAAAASVLRSASCVLVRVGAGRWPSASLC